MGLNSVSMRPHFIKRTFHSPQHCDRAGSDGFCPAGQMTEEMNMSLFSTDQGHRPVSGAVPPEWSLAMAEMVADHVTRRAAEKALEVDRYLPIEDDEMPA
jgi:hypothetical protein